MITLDVRGYCSDCTDFEAAIDQKSATYLTSDGFEKNTDTIVRCKYRNRCEGIKRFLEKEALKNGTAQ